MERGARGEGWGGQSVAERRARQKEALGAGRAAGEPEESAAEAASRDCPHELGGEPADAAELPLKLAEVADAVLLLADGLAPIGMERVPLADAGGRVLGEALLARQPLPPFRRAAMDGYAVREADLAPLDKGDAVHLAVAGERRPGRACGQQDAPPPGSALRIFTGARVPEGYDRVVMQERTRRLPGGAVELDRPPGQPTHIAEIGEDAPAGAVLLEAGARLRARQVALLAADGRGEAQVRRRPVVAVVPVGDELRRPGQPLGSEGIYDSNSAMLAARVLELGGIPAALRPVPDDPRRLAEAIREAALSADLVVTAGGVSVGDCDYAHEAARLAGGRVRVDRMKMRPGTPTSAYRMPDGTLLAALSGNPSACFAGMELLVRPLLLRLAGRADWMPRWRTGRLAASLSKPCPYPRYIRSAVGEAEDGMALLLPLAGDRSGNVAAFARADALACVPAGGKGAAEGTLVRWLELDAD
ncbi:Molybdopterin biosynthesis protein MoeA [Paenibacillus pasadenensis]|uniref:Molybdopterin molybdenumtransferase n=1 Tax=Paenibacillus pasadenensis TaxID=217090 RepID=A0A2N5NC12_9BACL|nr:gephyrin-like molybdotransferase Glp [Paenibacillus pasadenensis]PLT47790.1 Molybdopterin biosynthesis protein MoeA [Paenibacillus pasadenensis]